MNLKSWEAERRGILRAVFDGGILSLSRRIEDPDPPESSRWRSVAVRFQARIVMPDDRVLWGAVADDTEAALDAVNETAIDYYPGMREAFKKLYEKPPGV